MENEGLVRDLVSWLAAGARTYDEVMAAWRTSCPRLTVWEDAVDHGLIERFHDTGGRMCVRTTEAGLRFLEDHVHDDHAGVRP